MTNDALPTLAKDARGLNDRECLLANMPAKKHLMHIRELDGLRGIAALAVFFHHVLFAQLIPTGWGRDVGLLWNISAYGYTGVDLFFVLSGFLITSLLIEDRKSPRYYQNFYWKRALRILPLYAVCLLGVLIVYPHSGSYVLMAALFVANFAGMFHIALEGPFWTLAIEEQFYLLWPTVVRRRSIEAISRFAVAIWFSAFVLRLIAASFGKHNYLFTFLHSDGLAMGAWLACLFERRNRTADDSRVRRIVWPIALASGAILFSISCYITGGLRAEAYAASFRQTAVSIFAGTLVAFLLLHRGKSYLSVFRSRILTFFGAISYAFYMTHAYVLFTYDRYFPLKTGDLAAYVVRVLAIMLITIGISLASRYLLELPAMSLRKYVLHKG